MKKRKLKVKTVLILKDWYLNKYYFLSSNNEDNLYLIKLLI